jgi:molybdate transport system ATP-binding protein
MVRACAGPSVLLARITSRSAHALDLHAGKRVWIQVKSVALVR